MMVDLLTPLLLRQRDLIQTIVYPARRRILQRGHESITEKQTLENNEEQKLRKLGLPTADRREEKDSKSLEHRCQLVNTPVVLAKETEQGSFMVHAHKEFMFRR